MLVSTILAATAWAVPDIDTPLATGHAGEGVAVVVGIEDYAFLPDVPYARGDASAMTDAFALTMGLGPDRVTTLPTANREQLLDAVTKARGAAAGAPVYVFFAGHGATSPSGELLLVGDDAKADASVFVERSVSVQELAAAAGPDAVLWLDTCYAGVGRGGQALIPGARLAVPVYATDTLGGAQVWTAASPTEVSLPYAPARHGTFTYFLAGGLRGWADGAVGPADGQVALGELWAWIEQGMRRVEAEQTPQRRPAELDHEDRPLSSGPLEAAPTDLPSVRAARTVPTTPAPGGVVGGVLGPGPSITLTPPFTVTKNQLFDATGRGTGFEELRALGLGPDVDRAQTRIAQGRTATMIGATGVVAGLATSVAGLLISSGNQSDWDSYQALCNQGLRDDAQCNAAEPGMSGAVWVGAGVTVGSAIAIPLGGRAAKRARNDLATRANEVLR